MQHLHCDARLAGVIGGVHVGHTTHADQCAEYVLVVDDVDGAHGATRERGVPEFSRQKSFVYH
jgi:hypothetical protein